MLTKDYHSKSIDPAELQDLKAIADVEISNITLEDYPNLLVFPDSFCAYDRDFGKKYICSITHDEKHLVTNSIVGFVGRNNTRLSINSRFTADSGNDYFLHYMLQRVSKINILNLNHSFEEDSIFDFLLYLFPLYLKRAIRQGLFKKYITYNHNDSNVRGVININDHIRKNVPFNGKVAYSTREYSYDNEVTQLIRHTVEAISNNPTGANILRIDEETSQAVRIISDATPTYSHGDLQRVIASNLKPLSHPFYSEYTALQKLCLQILRHEELKYGQDDNEVYGVLIDAAWLWEEYLADVLNDSLHHYIKDSGKRFYLFEDNIQRIIPDYLSIDRKIVADAKYIPLDEEGEYGEEKATAIYYKTIAYMYRFGADNGYLLYPHRNQYTTHITEYTIKSDILSQTKNHIFKIGLRIPLGCKRYQEFINKMTVEEGLFKSAIPQ